MSVKGIRGDRFFTEKWYLSIFIDTASMLVMWNNKGIAGAAEVASNFPAIIDLRKLHGEEGLQAMVRTYSRLKKLRPIGIAGLVVGSGAMAHSEWRG